ncbi:VTC4B [Auxenochlorella protothecoides x Auxenochlorella symbiontica]
MKFGKYLLEKSRAEWAGEYVDYKALKDLIKISAADYESNTLPSFSPRTTSLTVQRVQNRRDSAEEDFFKCLDSEVEKVGRFTAQLVAKLRERLEHVRLAAADVKPEDAEALLEDAKNVGDEFLQLEKYVNLNYMGFHKILKKHDKMLPASPCRQFYIAHLHNQPWVQGNYSDLLFVLSNVYSKLRGDKSATVVSDPGVTQGVRCVTTKFWVRMSDVSTVKHHLLQHLPVYQVSPADFSGDAELVNQVYLDNSSLELYHCRLDKRPNAMALRLRWQGGAGPTLVHVDRKTHKESWQGEESEAASIVLPEERVVGFLEGEYSVEEAAAEWAARQAPPPGEAAVEAFRAVFTDVQRVVDAKQLKPTMRTQYMRTRFQIPFDPSVSVNLDTTICMMKENPEDGPTCSAAGRWYRDPALPVARTEITRFPHAVLEIKLTLAGGDAPPPWVSELTDSGLLTEVSKFSKYIQGVATLFADMVQAVPYWVDDEVVRASMLLSAPELPAEVHPTARDLKMGKRSKSRMQGADMAGPGGGASAERELRHPLLGDAPTLRLMPGGSGRRLDDPEPSGLLDWWFRKPPMAEHKALPPGTLPERMEPKTYFANERTFLAWLHMAVTIGSIATALLGYSGATQSAKHPEEAAPQSVQLIAIILLPVALLMCGYALLVYLWRTNQIASRALSYIDDRRGPRALAWLVVAALGAIMTLGIVDLVEEIEASRGGSPPPLAAAAAVRRLLGA